MHAFSYRINSWKSIVFICEMCGWIIIINIIIIIVFSVCQSLN